MTAEQKIPMRYLQDANIVIGINDAGVARLVKNRHGGNDHITNLWPDPHPSGDSEVRMLAIDMDGSRVILFRDEEGPQLEDGLLTRDEHDAMKLSAALANKIGKIIRSNPNGQADHDWNEAAQRIHAVQHMILAQAAGRAYPDHYRLLGGWPSSGDGDE